MIVAPEVLNVARSWPPSAATSRLAITSVAPTHNGRNSSRAAMSKESVVTATSASVASSPGFLRMEESRLTTAWWGIVTPLGFPVDPEV